MNHVKLLFFATIRERAGTKSLEMDIQFASYDKEHFVRFRMVMPDELSLNFCQLEMIIIHLCNDLRGPVPGNFCQFFLKVNG